jgi:hypothetical protein
MRAGFKNSKAVSFDDLQLSSLTLQKTNSHQPQLKDNSLMLINKSPEPKLADVKEEISSSSENSSFKDSSSD